MKNIWLEESVQEAIELHKSGLTFNEIATKLNRTEKAVKLKLNRLGLKQNKLVYHEDIICLNCGGVFTALKVENRKFCSQSCAATYNGLRRPKKKKEESIVKSKRKPYKRIKNNYCLFCGNLVYDKYCGAQCRKDYERKNIFEKIENNQPLNVGSIETEGRWCKKYLIEKYGEKCMDCGWDKANTYSGHIPIELEHIDGDSSNNTANNIKLLCPNCHSLTPTYKYLNKGNGRHSRRERYKNNKSY
jgi:hypothetical protein